MRKSTPRTTLPYNIYEKIGCILTSNLFPTFKGMLLYVMNDRCYFEIIENEEITKYNSSAGTIEYLPLDLVNTIEFDS